MKSKNILVTGAAGFIGFYLSKSLLNDGFNVIGVDNMNTYYDINLKKNRLKLLIENSNFSFHKVDISNYEEISIIFKKFKPYKVINLAAQAGVRYSIKNPFAYSSSNLVGFVNIIELCRECNVDGLIYASSSSVYGGNTELPFKVEDKTEKPISLYGATKKANELIAYSYSHLYDLHTTGLRFFTVYGPWGRPDMAYYIFTDKIISEKEIKVFNNGKCKRDFTYIDDIIFGIRSAMEKNLKCEIFNLGNNKTESVMDFINVLENEIGQKATIKFLPPQKGDMDATFADINKSMKFLGYKPSISINEGLSEFVNWYKEYYKII